MNNSDTSQYSQISNDILESTVSYVDFKEHMRLKNKEDTTNDYI